MHENMILILKIFFKLGKPRKITKPPKNVYPHPTKAALGPCGGFYFQYTQI